MADGRAALESAIDRENIVVFYQPIHDVASRRIVAAEALMRQRRENGVIREASLITETAEKAPREEIERAAVEEGMRTMWEDGVGKVAAGITSVEELARVCTV